MKYEIEIQIATIGDGETEKIKQILDGESYEVIDMSECGGLIDDEETARRELGNMRATARRREDGNIVIHIPTLLCGQEELEEDVMDGDEPFYYLTEFEEIDRQDFDEESWELFHELGY